MDLHRGLLWKVCDSKDGNSNDYGLTSHFKSTAMATYDVFIQQTEESVRNVDDWAFVGDMLD